MIAAEKKLPEGERVDFVSRRDAQPHALRDRQGVRRGRLQRRLRQADDVRSRPGRAARRGRARRPASSSPSATTTPATRWSARPARWSRPASWARSTPCARSTSRAGCAPGWRAAARSRPTGAPTRSAPASPAASATSAPTPTTSGRFVTGLLPDQVSCHLKTFVPGRALDDYGTAVIR